MHIFIYMLPSSAGVDVDPARVLDPDRFIVSQDPPRDMESIGFDERSWMVTPANGGVINVSDFISSILPAFRDWSEYAPQLEIVDADGGASI